MSENCIIEETEEEIIEAPLFGLEKWRKKNGLTSPKIEAYVEKRNEQTLVLVLMSIIIIAVMNYVRYGVI